MTPLFSDEVQLAGWSDTHSGGAKVTLWLNDSALLDKFRAMTMRKGNVAGHRLACVMMEINDQEQLVSAEQEKPKVGELCYWLVLRCNEPEFWRFLDSTQLWEIKIKNQYLASAFVKQLLKIQSRKELDENTEATYLFHEKIRGPYAKWCLAKGIK
jgi:hypothetical protein